MASTDSFARHPHDSADHRAAEASNGHFGGCRRRCFPPNQSARNRFGHRQGPGADRGCHGSSIKMHLLAPSKNLAIRTAPPLDAGIDAAWGCRSPAGAPRCRDLLPLGGMKVLSFIVGGGVEVGDHSHRRAARDVAGGGIRASTWPSFAHRQGDARFEIQAPPGGLRSTIPLPDTYISVLASSNRCRCHGRLETV